jgi:outer membrane receptor protein involved in Fe transport
MTRYSLRLFTLLTLTICVNLSAQITGALRGTVSDASGSSVPKAKVTLTNLDTRQVRTQDVNTQGEFTFDLLTVGNYSVKAEASGFASAEAQALVKTGEISSVAFKLEVGSVNQVIEVNSVVAQLDTENSQLQTSITGQSIQEVPVNRNPNNFVLGVPGVAPVSAGNPFLSSGSFNSNGGRGRGNNITVDGITATDVSVTGTGGPLSPLNFSSIKEVKIITNNFSAEYGRNSSAQVMYITKGGGNELHGELYEYLQNNDLNARGFFDTSGKASISKVNTYGFEVGGPVYIPKLFNGKNKAFWHADYEGFKQRGVGAPQIAPVPTPAQLASITDPTSLAIAKQYNLPSSASGTVTASAPATTDTWEQGYRGDFVLGKNDNLWARYAVFNSFANSTGNTFISSKLPYFGAASSNHPRQATLAETHLFGAAAVNEFRFGFGQSKPNFPIQTPYPLGPQISFADGSVTSIGVSNILPQGREQRTYQYTDNFTLTRGVHNLKMGFEWYHLEADSFFDSNIRGTFTFASFAAFAAGQLSTYSQNFGNSVRANRVENKFAFVQDDWKVTRKLILNLGLRLEWAGGPTEADGKISNLNLDNKSSYGAAGSGVFGLMESGKPSFNSNYNWGPRVGFAWQPTGDQKTVVRGGYGIAYDFVFLNPITNQRFLPPLIYAGALSGASSFTGGNSLANLFAGTADIQKQLNAQVGTLGTTLKNFGAISPAIAQNLRNSQVQQRSLGIEREIVNNLVLKVTYVGTKGTYLPRTRPINFLLNQPAPATSLADEQARLSQFTAAFAGLNGTTTTYSNRYDPRYNAINYVESSGQSGYNGLQIELQKRFAKHFFVNLAYSWAHSLDDSSDVLNVLANDNSAQETPNDNHNNRASSQFDLRHVLSVTHTWELPFFLGSPNRLVRGILGGWSFAGISSVRSGFPITLYAGSYPSALGGFTDPLAYLGSGNNVDRPNVTGTITNWNPRPTGSAGAPSGTSVVNGVAISNYAQSLGLTQPFIGGYGNMGRNLLRINGQQQFDWDLFKNFHFSEKVNFQIRAEFYNIFNNHAFQTVAGASNGPAITASNFGQYTTVSQNARTIQVGARIVF